ncbi:helix-turn-helix domain-containing protein [Actinoalloteichus hymeniacidonis]|uniref:DNA binding protein with helix-turn-helix domain n=1 Tax=Actinoalloteichus hymeniacidonis TaxID=340345 RepID=A0AAC9HKV2_9PSEU|nr:helix-turn-helix transcriptional regulator [Actinoalloteichus hymeniacidonis]AOS61207.1 DNA binding protein with helix-turn-helix domain [Actinoalloteichus hymeniacidonis]MBB5910791.1 transcriptional regulator with XRE-family HTH domain [Actinoalloteichus hymeniacidonis]
MASTNKSPLVYALGEELKRLRLAKGLTVRAVGRLVGADHTLVSRTESGVRKVSPEEIARWLGAIGADNEDYDRILEMARDATRATWSEVNSPGLPTLLDTLIKYEQQATAITEVNPMLVPGLLQTRDYAMAVMSDGDLAADKILPRVMYRLGRQDVLHRKDGPHFTALIEESVLLRHIGGHCVMADQLDYLLEASSRKNVDVRVIPLSAGAHGGLAGAWVLLEFPVAPPIVHLEHVGSATFLHKRPHTQSFLNARSSLLDIALNGAESAEVITSYADQHRRNGDS